MKQVALMVMETRMWMRRKKMFLSRRRMGILRLRLEVGRGEDGSRRDGLGDNVFFMPSGITISLFEGEACSWNLWGGGPREITGSCVSCTELEIQGNMMTLIST